MAEPVVMLVHGPIPADELRAAVDDDAAGAVITFEGVTREVPLLRFEAYEPMAIQLLAEHARRAQAEHGLQAVAIAHRLGDVPLGEASIMIVVSAGHRPEAFAATRWLIDAIKQDVPIWKQEVTADGASWGRSEDARARRQEAT